MARRGGYAKGAISRELILDRAVELFGEVGYSAASLRDVARHSGMTHSGLLHHFPNKEALLTGVLDRRDKIEFERLESMVPTVGKTTEGLFDFIAHGQKDMAGVRLYNMLATEATSPSHPANEYFVNRYRQVFELVRTMVESAQGEGVLSSVTPSDSLARMFVALVDGLQLQWLLETSQEDKAESEPSGDVAASAAETVDLPAIFADFLQLLGDQSRAQTVQKLEAVETPDRVVQKSQKVALHKTPLNA